jgi:hypothetical protein
MAVILQNQQLTLAEINKISGNIETGNMLAEFAQRNTFLDEVPWLPTTHGSHTEEFRAKSLGAGGFTRINGGIPQVGATGDIIKEPTRLYEGESVVDDRLLLGADDPYRAREAYDKMRLEGIMQGFNHELLYSNDVQNPDALKSFTQRRSSLGEFCFDAGGTGTGLTSAWLFEFGAAGVHLIYNKAGSPGLKNEDKGIHRSPAPDGSGNPYYAWVRHYEIWSGLVIGQERACMRIANINAGNPFDPRVLIENMKPYLPTPGGSMAVLFVPRSVYGQIEWAAYSKGNASYSLADIMGFGQVVKVAGIPVRPWDAISENESAVA